MAKPSECWLDKLCGEAHFFDIAMKIWMPLLIAFLTVSFAIAVFCVCEWPCFIAGNGDAGNFILQNEKKFGGIPITTNGLPRISGSWSYYENNLGTTIRLPEQAFPVVQSLLKASAGPPESYGAGGIMATSIMVTRSQQMEDTLNFLVAHSLKINTLNFSFAGILPYLPVDWRAIHG